MANIKSALKRIQTAERNRLRNKSYRSSVKTLTKSYLSALDTYASNPSPESLEEVQARMSKVFSRLDKAVKRGVYHPNTAARRKSSLSRALKRVEAAESVAPEGVITESVTS